MASSVIFNLLPLSTTSKPARRLASFQNNHHSFSHPSWIHPSSLKPNLFSVKTAPSSPSSVSVLDPAQLFETDSRPVDGDEKFDWYSHWYPIMPICDLDKRVPHAKKVIGIDVVVWWDRTDGDGAWKVFDDRCPHRLAPLSEGRIDQWGRLQCVYHGWCFDGAGDCKLIPQAPLDGAPVHTFKKACVASYPCTAQNGILWFWPNNDPEFKDVISVKKPPYIPELDDPSFTHTMGNREIPYGYEILIENLMDPAHVPYAHYGIMRGAPKSNSPKQDLEGGKPLDMSILSMDASGYTAKQDRGMSKFIPPCVFYAFPGSPENSGGASSTNPDKVEESSSSSKPQRKFLLVFICIPVSPGKSRLIWTFPRNVGVWIDKIVPRWVFHVNQNLVLDSDLYLLHLEEHKIMEAGPSNWQKACFVPTKSDALVVGFRRWLNKYAGGGVDWRNKFSDSLPPTPPREQLMDRYWTHVVHCSSCRNAIKYLRVVEAVLPIVSVAMLGIVAAVKQNTMSTVARTGIIGLAILCYAFSRWLSHFIYKNFYYHDYNHALR